MKPAKWHRITGEPAEVGAALELARREGRLVSVGRDIRTEGEDSVTVDAWLRDRSVPPPRSSRAWPAVSALGWGVAILAGIAVIGAFQELILQGLAVVLTCLIFVSVMTRNW